MSNYIRQGSMSINQYLLKFRTLAAASSWNEQALITVYRQGLDPKLRLHLAAYDDTLGLERFIQLSIRCSNRMQSCSPHFPAAIVTPPYRRPEISSSPEPMQTDSNRLSSAERRRRLMQGLCLYCGASGHMIMAYPLNPPRPMVSAIQPSLMKMNPLSTCAQLTASNVTIPVSVLLDSGSAGNFIAGSLCRQLRLPTSATETVYQVQSITGKPLSRRHVRHSAGPIQLRIGQLHLETLHLLVLEGSTVDIILGRPWLVQHDPILSWRTGEVLKWGDSCFSQCFPDLPQPSPSPPVPLAINSTSIESPVEKQSVEIPSCYTPFSDVFCPKRAAQLPPHRPWDCAIDLFPGEPVPHGKIYPLSLPEQKAMEEYIEEALRQGYIVPSTSPAASSFFFVAKKDGGLRPCIDYRALNNITVKFRYPLPLVPAALEHLCGATIFTKLDLRSAYNLIRIRQGDEWKTAFLTSTGHYEYRVMPHGLVNAPSIFQDFMHEVLREFLHRFVIVYIDDILIYSRSLAEHRHHVAEVLKQLRKFHLFLKAEKCTFHQPTIQLLSLHPCAAFSQKLSPAEKNYDIGNRELLAIKLALEEWRHWLEGAAHPFLVLTDHKNLQYLRDAKRLNPRQARWALFFNRFNFKILYRPGPRNVKADALSRIYAPEEVQEEPERIIPAELIASPIQWTSPPVASENPPAIPPGCPPDHQYVPRTQRTPLIHSTHTSLGTGHPGVNNTLSLLRDRFW